MPRHLRLHLDTYIPAHLHPPSFSKVRAALENKRAYATRHHYSLYVLDDRRRGDGDDAAP